jgi:hypothetical protein
VKIDERSEREEIHPASDTQADGESTAFDWGSARSKLEALWTGKAHGRPCIAVTAPKAGGGPAVPAPNDPEDRWLSPDWVLADLRARLRGTWWGGEVIPSYLLMGGWMISANGRPRFSQGTIWFDAFDVDLRKPSPFVVREDDPWIRKHRKLYLAVAEESARDGFLLGAPCFLPANDLLSMHMGTENFMVALMDEPEWMKATILRAAREQQDHRRRLQSEAKIITPYWYGNAGWMPFWAPQPFVGMQSDVSCMLSPNAFETFVVPELDLLGSACGAMWYHLDGHDARQHLPRLLSLPYMRVIQYTPTPSEPLNGPEHLEFYKSIQKAGRIVHIQVTPENIEKLAGKLDPTLLMLDTACASESAGLALLAKAEQW